jgi:hypothetical protein
MLWRRDLFLCGGCGKSILPLSPLKKKRQRVYREWLDFGMREALTLEVQPLQRRRRP